RGRALGAGRQRGDSRGALGPDLGVFTQKMKGAAMTSSALSASELRSERDGKSPPIVIDVRRQPAFLEADVTISGALRRYPELVRAWAKSLPRASSVDVYCVHGQIGRASCRERGASA